MLDLRWSKQVSSPQHIPANTSNRLQPIATNLKIERLLAITVMLLNRREITARELAERFEVSVRTIYRDVETLNGAGIPVVSSQGHEGGLTMPDHSKLNRQLLTFADMLSLLTALKGVNKTLRNDDLERFIDKVTALIPDGKEPLYRTHADSFVIDISHGARPAVTGRRCGPCMRR